MKKLYFFAILGLLINSNCTAQTLIAVTNETGSTFYSNLDTAIVKATSGDYIYLPGGSFKISKPINKKLQIVGVGHNPDSCAVTGITQVTGNFVINSGSDHGSITGLKIYGDITFIVGATDPVVNYYSIERCNLGNVYPSTRSLNILVCECVIHGNIRGDMSGSSSQGFLLSNCIVEGYFSGFLANTFINNNVFMNSFTYPTTGCFFKNNIFLFAGPIPTESYTALYQNNSFTTAVSSLYNCHNNIVAPVAGLFKNKTKALFDYDQDYHILVASPAHLAGTDGTDLGIYGTSSPWKEGSVPSSPHLQTKTVSTIDGKPNVKIKVAAQDY